MEVVVTEEKKKIFRARKTMKISDRQQLESLHSTLLTAAPGLSEASPPPLMNGTHKEDGQKVGDKEQNNVSDSNSPRATSPASPASLSSPAPFLSLNLSPSPPSSQSPNGKEDASPSSPFHSLNFELKKMEDDEEEEEEKKEEKKFTLSSSSNESVTPASTESKENPEEVKEVKQETETKEAEQTKKDSAVDLEKNSVKGLVPCSSVPSPVSDFTEPMDTDNDTVKAKEPEASTAKTKDEKPPSPKSTTSDSSLPHPSSSSHPASSSCADVKQEKETKEEVKEEEDDKEDVKKGSISEAKMEVDSLKVQTKKEKTEVRQTTKPSRPASTPPSNTVAQEDKGSTSGLKRTLSEGYEKDERPIKREVKRPKVEREELEAQLELKITAKAGSHHKLEKIVQQLVDERLRALQLTIFDKHFEELKERVDKIDCATKHQTAINTLQAKIARLAKKFGEANQASENKRKQEALAAAAAAAAATAAATAAKTTAVSNNPQVPRVLRRQAVEPQPEVPRERVAPSVGKTPALPVKKEKEEEEMEEEEEEEEEERDMSRHIAMAKKLSEYSEGNCRADIKLRTITSHLEKVLYHNCKRSSGNPRPDRYASYIFRYLVPYDVYCDWVAKVNYVGLLGKEALPMNLRRTMRMYIERRFPLLLCDSWREIRDAINEILRVKRRPEFFREYDERTAVSF